MPVIQNTKNSVFLDCVRMCSAEGLYAAEVQSVFFLQFDQFIAGCDVSEENAVPLYEPRSVERIVRLDGQPLVLELMQDVDDHRRSFSHGAIVTG